MKTRILLVRHGGTLLSADNRFAGATDVALSDEGRKQADLLSKRLADVRIAAVYCSPLNRTVDTATRLAARHGLVPSPREGLREINHGQWEGHVHSEIETAHASEYAAWDADPFTYAPPGGETGMQVLSRALPALRQIVVDHPGQTALVVSHTATNRILIGSLLGLDLRLYRKRINQDLSCLNVLDFSGPWEAKVTLLNDVSHYAPAPA